MQMIWFTSALLIVVAAWLPLALVLRSIIAAVGRKCRLSLWARSAVATLGFSTTVRLPLVGIFSRWFVCAIASALRLRPTLPGALRSIAVFVAVAVVTAFVATTFLTLFLVKSAYAVLPYDVAKGFLLLLARLVVKQQFLWLHTVFV